MVNYRRDITPGGTYFFTLLLRDRRSDLLTKHIKLLGQYFRHASKNNPFVTEAIVILPEHLHVVWWLPTDDHDYSTRWRQIKTYFTRALLNTGEPLVCNARNAYNLWQRRFLEHRIKNDFIKKPYISNGLINVNSQSLKSRVLRVAKLI